MPAKKPPRIHVGTRRKFDPQPPLPADQLVHCQMCRQQMPAGHTELFLGVFPNRPQVRLCSADCAPKIMDIVNQWTNTRRTSVVHGFHEQD